MIKKLKSIIVLVCCLMALNYEASAGNENIMGIWKGTIESPVHDVDIYWRISIESNGSLSGLYDCPFYGIKDVPVTTITVNEDSVLFDLSLFPATFYGLIDHNKKEIPGFFSGEGDGVTPLTAKKIEEDPEAVLNYMKPRVLNGKQVLEYSYTVPEEMDGGWKTGHLQYYGFDLNLLQNFSELALQEKYPNLHSMLIIKDGVLVYEEYFYGYDKNKPHHIYSNGKGLSSLSIGIANEKGAIPGLETPICEYFKEYDVLQSGEKNTITIEHMLSMTAGFEWDETSTSYYDQRNSNRQMMNASDELEFLFTRPLVYTPGTQFTYNSGIPYALKVLLARATEMPVVTFMQDHIFTPMGFLNYAWDTKADGTLSGNFLRPRDFAKLAKLYLNKGEWQGTKIIDSEWFEHCYKPGRRCDGYEYWNHWGKSELFVNGTPVVKYSGGGFGGQAIIGFPDLDLVVVFTGGNYFTPSVNHDDILTKYILPPLVKANSGYQLPDFSSSPGFKSLDGLEYKKTFFTNLGALWGCLEYLGSDLNEAWIYGLTGTAFAMNAHPRMYPNSLGRWDNPHFEEQIENAGYDYSTVAIYQGHEKFDEYQEMGWNMVREAIDNGFPAYGFHMNIPENYVIYGYDDFGYYYKGVDCSKGYGPKCWNKVARNDVGWFEVHTLKPMEKQVSKGQLVAKSLEVAVEMGNPENDFGHHGFEFGPKAYDLWKDILISGDADWFGVAYAAAGWETCRRNAVQFLQECIEYVEVDKQVSIQKAVEQYKIITQNWKEISELFPYEGKERWERIENWQDQEKRNIALELINESAKHEALAFDALKIFRNPQKE